MKNKNVIDLFADFVFETEVFRSNSNLRAAADVARRFARNKVLPLSEKLSRQDMVDDCLVNEIGELGLYSASIPEQYGGAGLGGVGDSAIVYELAYGDMAVSLLPIVTTSLFGRAVQIGGTEDQKKKILPKIASGEEFGCYALTESGGSSFSRHNRTLAVRDGSGYRLNGEKIFITEARRANRAVVIARIGDQTSDKFGAFIVPNAEYNGGNGYRFERKDDKVGIKASETCVISMSDVELPPESLLGGEETNGNAVALQTLGMSRPVIAAQSLGNAAFALSYAIQYAHETERGGGNFIMDLPVYQAELGEACGKLASQVTYLFSVARQLDERDISLNHDLRMLSSTLKSLATKTGTEICYHAMRSLGGHGYTNEHPLGRRWVDSVVAEIYEGANPVQNLIAGGTIAKVLSGKYPRGQ